MAEAAAGLDPMVEGAFITAHPSNSGESVSWLLSPELPEYGHHRNLPEADYNVRLYSHT